MSTLIGTKYLYKFNCEKHNQNDLIHSDEYFNKILQIQDELDDFIIITINQIDENYIIKDISIYQYEDYLKLINKEYLKEIPEILDLIYKPYDFAYNKIYVISEYEYFDFNKLDVLLNFNKEFKNKSLKYLLKILKHISSIESEI